MDIVLVDDHTATRMEMASIIDEQEDLHVVAQAADGAECIRLAKKLHPGMVVMDVIMPGMNGITATQTLGREMPEILILALSNHTGKNLVDVVLRAGAKGFIRKDRAYEELVQAIRAVASNKQYIGARCDD